MPLADLYAYLLERKLMTPVFYRPREGLLAPSFDLSKKCEHHFGAERHTLEECYHLKDRIQDLIDNKLIQFNNAATSNIVTNPLPPPPSGRECECHHHSGRKGSRFLLTIIPVEGYAPSLGPREPPCS